MEDGTDRGNATNKYRGANLHPEFQSSSWYISDNDDFPVRTKDPYDVAPEDREQILETLKYWEGKSMEDYSKTILPPHIEECIQDDIITVGLRNGVSGETTCDHEKIFDRGPPKVIWTSAERTSRRPSAPVRRTREKINY